MRIEETRVWVMWLLTLGDVQRHGPHVEYTYQQHCQARQVWRLGTCGTTATNIQLLDLYKSESVQHNIDPGKALAAEAGSNHTSN